MTFQRLGHAPEEVVRSRLAALKRSLPYYYRQQRRNDLAGKQVASLLWESPGDPVSYIELIKSCVPISLARALRRLRELVS